MITNAPYATVPTTVTKTANYTTTWGEVVLANANGGAFTVTLPAATAARSRITVKKTDSSANAVTIAPAAGTIDGAASVQITAQYEARDFVSDGSNWFQV